MTHLGRDFSSYQGNLTDADVEGIEYAYVKATQSGGDTGYQNPDAPQQAAMLRKHGVHVGFYHFFDPKVSVLDQLHDFQRYVSALGGSALPPAIDSETLAPGGWPTLASDMVDFCMGVESWNLPVTNPRSMIYNNVSFARSLPGWPWGRWVWLADPSNAGPTLPRLIIQTAPRPVSGQDLKVVDPDTFVGSEADWASFIGQQAAPAPAPLPTNTVPGPNGLQLEVIGRMVNGSGLFYGRGSGGAPVYAAVGSPTQWVANFNPKALPEGTALAVPLSDAGKVATAEAYEQL